MLKFNDNIKEANLKDMKGYKKSVNLSTGVTDVVIYSGFNPNEIKYYLDNSEVYNIENTERNTRSH